MLDPEHYDYECELFNYSAHRAQRFDAPVCAVCRESAGARPAIRRGDRGDFSRHHHRAALRLQSFARRPPQRGAARERALRAPAGFSRWAYRRLGPAGALCRSLGAGPPPADAARVRRRADRNPNQRRFGCESRRLLGETPRRLEPSHRLRAAGRRVGFPLPDPQFLFAVDVPERARGGGENERPLRLDLLRAGAAILPAGEAPGGATSRRSAPRKTRRCAARRCRWLSASAARWDSRSPSPSCGAAGRPPQGRALRILMVTGIFPPDRGGPASSTPKMATALHGFGHTVTVICLSDRLDHDDRAYPFRSSASAAGSSGRCGCCG